jgi:WD40 repeat protein
VATDSTNNVAISIGYDGKILIWSISPAQSISQQRRAGIRSSSSATLSPAATFTGHSSPILECNYHDNGGLRGVLASGDREGKVILWEIESGSMIARYKGHNGSVTALDTIRNSNENKTYFMTGGSDGMVKVLAPPRPIFCPIFPLSTCLSPSLSVLSTLLSLSVSLSITQVMGQSCQSFSLKDPSPCQ